MEMVSLDTLALKKHRVLLDTNIFGSSDDSNERGSVCPSFEERYERIQGNFDFILLIEHYLEEGCSFYISSSVFEELQAVHYPFKRAIKRRGSVENRELLELHRLRRLESKEKRHVANLFQDYGKILHLVGDEQIFYNVLLRRYEELKLTYGLSDTDFDLAISGTALVKTGSSVDLVSNDKGILKAERDIKREEKLFGDRIMIFMRNPSYEFERRI